MKEKLIFSGDMTIRQEAWERTPCSSCPDSPCCRNLPLVKIRPEKRADFVNLITASCHEGLLPALDRSGEWTLYLVRSCISLGKPPGKCLIHGSGSQSLVCKSYDAHGCWYKDAFCNEGSKILIPFNTEMLIWFEKKYELFKNGFDIAPDWEELCNDAGAFLSCNGDSRALVNPGGPYPPEPNKLPYRDSRSDKYLFFPPYKKPVHRNHFELAAFRLGFPGVYLAVADNLWAFMVRTSLDRRRLELVRKEYYPGIGHGDGKYCFDNVVRESGPLSGDGGGWIIIGRQDLEHLKEMTIFDSAGKIKKLPSCRELAAGRRTQG